MNYNTWIQTYLRKAIRVRDDSVLCISPLRNEDNPSFCITLNPDENKFVYYDHTTSQSGSIINLCHRMGWEIPEEITSSVSNSTVQVATDSVPKEEIVAEIWNNASTPHNHSYLTKKGIHTSDVPYIRQGIDFNGDSILIIPGYDVEGRLVGIERIYADPLKGKKHLGSKKGAFFNIYGGLISPDAEVVHLCEGFATAWAISNLQVKKEPIYECFGAAMFPSAIQTLKELNNKVRIYVHPDQGTNESIILKCRELGGLIVEMPVTEPRGSDWWDVMHTYKDSAPFIYNSTLGRLEPKEEERKDDLYFTREDEYNLNPVDWVIQDLLPKNSLVEVFGNPGCGKTFWVLGILSSIAAGLPFAGHPVKQAPALYFCGEGAAGIKRRISAWKKANNVARPIPLYISNKPGDFCDKEFMDSIRSAILKFKKENETPGIIAIDTLSRNISADINDNAAMANFIRNLESLQRDLGDNTIFMWVHHSPHSAPNRSLGAKALSGALDCSYGVEVKGTTEVKVTCRKMKDAIMPEPHVFTKEIIQVDPTNPTNTSLHLKLAKVEEEVQEKEIKELRLRGNQKVAYDTLLEAITDKGDFIKEDIPGVGIEVWREYFYKACNSKSQDSKKKAFQNARKSLTSKDIVKESHEEPCYFSRDVDCILAAAKVRGRLEKEENKEEFTSFTLPDDFKINI